MNEQHLRAKVGLHPLVGKVAFDAAGALVGTVKGVDPHARGAFLTVATAGGERYVPLDPSWTFKSESRVHIDRAEQALLSGDHRAADRLYDLAERIEDQEHRSLADTLQVERKPLTEATEHVAEATHEIADTIERVARANARLEHGQGPATGVFGSAFASRKRG